MTERLYYTDPSCTAFEAAVTESFTLDGRPAVALDRTAFYPTSGGQPCDTGTLGGASVIEVVDRDDGVVAHVLDRELFAGSRVEGAIDWARRFDHMQQHTGQHVLSSAFDRLLANRTMSFHMSAAVSTIDLLGDATPASIAAAEQEANRVVWEDHPVSIRFVPAEEAATLPLRKEPARGGVLRLIDIPGVDLSACGGTHVSRTGAIGVIAVTAWERFRGGTRLTFVCGGRALRLFRAYRDALAGATRLLSVVPDELPDAVERVQRESKELRRTLKAMQEALATHEAARFVAEAPVVDGVRIVARAIHGWDAAGLKAIATAAASRDSVVAALVSSASPAVAVVACSPDVKADAQAVLNGLVAEFGGRGGGKPSLAQGGGLDGDGTTIVAAARAAIEGQLSR
ncbi:MAG: alanyl-tRNA editing protein [Vicinamibacterales bacterium]